MPGSARPYVPSGNSFYIALKLLLEDLTLQHERHPDRSHSLSRGRHRAPPILPALRLYGVLGAGGVIGDGLLAGAGPPLIQDGCFTGSISIAGGLGRPVQIRELAIA